MERPLHPWLLRSVNQTQVSAIQKQRLKGHNAFIVLLILAVIQLIILLQVVDGKEKLIFRVLYQTLFDGFSKCTEALTSKRLEYILL